MPKYVVIKAHDGVKEGAFRFLPEASPLARYMVDNGYWRQVENEPVNKAAAEPQGTGRRSPETKTAKKATKKGK